MGIKLLLVVVLSLLITNVITCLITNKVNADSYALHAETHKNANVLNIKSAAEQNDLASFRLDMNKIKDIDKVMIIAHPDDETIWAGNHILNNKYLIVCITNGNNRVRRKEFFTAMEMSGNYGVMLNYPDNPKRIKNNWRGVKRGIRQDIAYILHAKKWSQIVTHNPEGEYGHIQHRFTSMLVTNQCAQDGDLEKLYYFEKYHSVKYMNKHPKPPILDSIELQNKEQLMTVAYPSQHRAHQLFDHMMAYEKLIPYSDWYFG